MPVCHPVCLSMYAVRMETWVGFGLVCAFVRAFVRACMRVCVCERAFVRAFLRACVRACVRECVSACVCVCSQSTRPLYYENSVFRLIRLRLWLPECRPSRLQQTFSFSFSFYQPLMTSGSKKKIRRRRKGHCESSLK